MLFLLLLLAVVLMSSSAQAGFTYVWGDYVATRSATGKMQVSHKEYGTWQGDAIAMNRHLDIVPVRHELSFEFESSNYFHETNKGHFAIAVLADRGADQLVGRGIIIGNVAEYGKRKNGCAVGLTGNRVMVETFWKGGNCVWGDSTASPRLSNNERYRVTLQAARSSAGEAGRLVTYRLEQKVGHNWMDVRQASMFDPNSIPAYSGWFILEVFSDGPWEMRFFNVTETVE